MKRLKTLFCLSIAASLIVCITEENDGLYKTISDDIYDIANKETNNNYIGEKYVKVLNKYRDMAFKTLQAEKDVKVIQQIILDNLAAVVVEWEEIKVDKYQKYARRLSGHMKTLSYYWRNSLDESAQERAFELTDEIMNKIFGGVE